MWHTSAIVLSVISWISNLDILHSSTASYLSTIFTFLDVWPRTFLIMFVLGAQDTGFMQMCPFPVLFIISLPCKKKVFESWYRCKVCFLCIYFLRNLCTDLVVFPFYVAAVTNASGLIGCKAQDLMLTISTWQIQAGKDRVAKRLTLQQVCTMFSCLFCISYFCWMHARKISQVLLWSLFIHVHHASLACTYCTAFFVVGNWYTRCFGEIYLCKFVWLACWWDK